MERLAIFRRYPAALSVHKKTPTVSSGGLSLPTAGRGLGFAVHQRLGTLERRVLDLLGDFGIDIDSEEFLRLRGLGLAGVGHLDRAAVAVAGFVGVILRRAIGIQHWRPVFAVLVGHDAGHAPRVLVHHGERFADFEIIERVERLAAASAATRAGERDRRDAADDRRDLVGLESGRRGNRRGVGRAGKRGHRGSERGGSKNILHGGNPLLLC